MYTYLRQALPRVVTHGIQVIKEEMEIASTVQAYKGEARASNEDSDEDRQTRFLACCV